MVQTPKEEKDTSLLVGLHTKIHCPMSLHYILFGRVGDLLHRLEHIFEDPPISLLPQIPRDVDNNSIETPTILLWHPASFNFPPFGQGGRVLLWELHR